MYKNIIFDFGGVVVQFNPKDFLMDHFMNKRAEEIVYELTFGSQEWQDLDRGTITREEGNAAMLETPPASTAYLRCRPSSTSGPPSCARRNPLCTPCKS